VSNTF
jgi:hypothetical protein